MIKIGDNIISSLGFTTDENFRAVESGISGVKHYEAGNFDLPEAFMASLIDKERLNELFSSSFENNTDLTELEKAVILSVYSANKEAEIDLSNPKTIFVISTTKGNVDLLSDEKNIAQPINPQVFLWYSAKAIAAFFRNPNTPVVVSNACISGASAQIAAMRNLQSGKYDYAVVVGVDFLSKFIISGFQSFKALSPDVCRPFDKDRLGLNLGEAAASIIYKKADSAKENRSIRLLNGAIRNDANHISGPSRTGEGSLRALNYVLEGIDKEEIAFVNAHGTATPYNDAMEAVALTRAGLEKVPVNSLKPFFGHTLGAAGVLESIISMRALTEKKIIKSLNFKEQSTDNPINISTKNHFSDKKYFIKMLSGFGGCNAVLLFERM